MMNDYGENNYLHTPDNLVSLGDYANIVPGYAFKSSGFTDNINDIHLVKGADIQQGHIDWENCRRWPVTNIESYSRFLLEENDVLIAMDRPWVPAGLKYAWIRKKDPQALLVQRVARLRGKNGLDSKFLRYVVASPSFTNYIKSVFTGVNVPHISSGQIASFTYYQPNMSIQHKIASILSAYDDLIENNNRRIQILEEMAQRIYREWFVHFRFPGHENVKMVDSQLGKIPEGWEVRRLSDKYSIQKGLSYRSKDLVESGGIPMINLKNINKGGGFRSDGAKYYVGEFKETHEVRTGDVIVAVTDMTADRYIAGRAARIPLSKTKAIISTDLVRIEPLEEISQGYTYGLFRFSTLPLYLKEFATGTNVQHLSPSSISIQKIVVPPKSLQDKYGFILENTYELADNLDSKNLTLRKTRDLLLPRLISGRLDVENLDIAG